VAAIFVAASEREVGVNSVIQQTLTTMNRALLWVLSTVKSWPSR
jgi:hypothetical protein